MTTIVFDLETVPTDAALAMAPDEDYLMRGTAASWRPDTIEAHRQKRRESWPSEVAKLASLDWRLGRIAALGYAIDDDDPVTCCGHDELTLLLQFWGEAKHWPADARLVGFAIRSFDLPWLLGRTGSLGVIASRPFDLRRYGGPVIDWAEILSGESGRTAGWTLGRYAQWFGLREQPWGAGEDVYGWWLEGNLGAIGKHLDQDLRTTRALDRRFAPAFAGQARAS